MFHDVGWNKGLVDSTGTESQTHFRLDDEELLDIYLLLGTKNDP
jgi:hypothetical protein